MLWPDMIWVYVLAYDIWNFQYTYLNLPTHSWYCGLALLLAPTLQQHSGIKAVGFRTVQTHWLSGASFAQVFPLFQDAKPFYNSHFRIRTGRHRSSNGKQYADYRRTDRTGIISVLSFAVNVFVFAYILKRAKVQKKNPWKNEIFTDTKDYKEAMERA